MNAIKILLKEISCHETYLNYIKVSYERAREDLNVTMTKINQGFDGTDYAHLYGLVYEYSNKICTYLHNIREIEKLISWKEKLIENNK